jgi:hypothetical protein
MNDASRPVRGLTRDGQKNVITLQAKAVAIGRVLLSVAVLVGWSQHLQAGVVVRDEAAIPAAPAAKLVVYSDGMSASPYVASGWMGNQRAIRFDDKCAVRPHAGSTCMKLQYLAPDQWGGIIWQDPPDDWGDRPGGSDLTGATRLTFWARGATGGEKVKFLFGVIKREKPYFDTAAGELDVVLTTEWTQYSIDLTGKDLSRIKSGFGWTLAGQGKPLTFYVDDVQYE